DPGITVTLPPPGVWKGSYALFPIGLFGILMVLGCSALFLFDTGLNAASAFGAVFVEALATLDIAAAVRGVHDARRPAIHDELLPPPDAVVLIARQSLFGIGQEEYAQARIQRIHAGNSNVEVNDRPLKQLRIVLCDPDRTIKLFTGRSEDELRWLA